MLFVRRAPPEAVYLVRSGSLEVVDDRVRPPVVLATMGPDSVVGEVAFIDGALRAATVQAREPTVLVVWTRQALVDLMAEDPQVAARIWQGLAAATVAHLRNSLDRAVLASPASDEASVPDDLAGAVARLSERLAQALAEPQPPAGDDPLVGVIEGLGTWLQHQGRDTAGREAGSQLREALASMLARSRTGTLLLGGVAEGLRAAELHHHLVTGVPEGDDEGGRRLDAALLALPTPRALRWRSERVSKEVEALLEGGLEQVCVCLPGWSPVDAHPGQHRGVTWQLTVRDTQSLGVLRRALDLSGATGKVRRLDPLVLDRSPGHAGVSGQDLVVIEALGDRLPDAHVKGLLDWASDALRPGGRLIIGALGPAPDDALFDLLLDWPSARREPRPLAFLLRSSSWEEIRARVCHADHGAASFVTAQRGGGAPREFAATARQTLSSEVDFGASLHDADVPRGAQGLELALEVSRGALQVMAQGELDRERRQVLTRAVAAAAGVDRRTASAAVSLAQQEALRAPLGPGERRLIARRLGIHALELVDHGELPELTLALFAVRHGAGPSVRLIDVAVQTLAADGELDGADLARLQAAAEELGVDPAGLSWLVQTRGAAATGRTTRHELVGADVLIGRDRRCDLVLSDPQVARRHARLTRRADTWWVHALGRRPLVVDGRPVASAPLAPGSRVRVGAQILVVHDDHVQVSSDRTFSALTVRGLSRAVDGRPLLQDLRFTGFAGELIALVGPSGAGKTTLLDAIRGLHPADVGEVLLDGRDFHRLLRADPSILGEVPQDDLVLPELTVAESLRSSAWLRLSSDVSRAELGARVEEVLTELGLEGIRDQRIGDPLRRGISGGQRKRVNLGQELITRSTRVLFLDEPTSGLDPRGAADVARLARRLADDGRLVFLVTHDLAPGVLAQVDQLLVLAPGGRLAFFGPPEQSCAHFGAAEVTQLFDRLGDRSPDEWAALWAGSPQAACCGEGREVLADVLTEGGADAPPATRTRLRVAWVRQLATLTARYARTRARDRTGAAILVAQPLVLAAVMAVVFTRATVALMFMLSLSWLWFGMSAAVRELITDRAIWRRERRVGVRVGPYLSSKALVLAAVVLAQGLVLAVAVHRFADLGDLGFSLTALVGVSAVTGLTGLALGLLVSAVWSSSEAAVGTLILLLVPQIAFSGILMPVRDMSPVAQALTWVTPARYALDATVRSGEELAYLNRKSWFTRPVRGDLFLLGLREADDEGLPSWQLLAALGLMGLVLLMTAGAVTWGRARPRLR